MKAQLLLAAVFAMSAPCANALTGKFQIFSRSGNVVEVIEFFDDLSLRADTLDENDCTGHYVYTWDGYLEITYNGPDGEGSLGGCHKASSHIDVGEVKLETVEEGFEFHVVTRSIMNDGHPKNLGMKKL